MAGTERLKMVTDCIESKFGSHVKTCNFEEGYSQVIAINLLEHASAIRCQGTSGQQGVPYAPQPQSEADVGQNPELEGLTQLETLSLSHI